MTIALRWYQDLFLCEFEMAAAEHGVLSVFSEGELIRQEIVRNAAAACARASEVCAALLAHSKRSNAAV